MELKVKTLAKHAQMYEGRRPSGDKERFKLSRDHFFWVFMDFNINATWEYDRNFAERKKWKTL